MIQRLAKTPPVNEGPARMVEIAPNQFMQLNLNFEMPPDKVVLCDVVPISTHPGHFKLVPRSWEKLDRVTEDLCEKLGLGRQTRTLRRLIRAAFVDGSRISPEVYNVNIASFFAHMKKCAEDPDYWQDRKVREQYLHTY